MPIGTTGFISAIPNSMPSSTRPRAPVASGSAGASTDPSGCTSQYGPFTPTNAFTSLAPISSTETWVVVELPTGVTKRVVPVSSANEPLTCTNSAMLSVTAPDTRVRLPAKSIVTPSTTSGSAAKPSSGWRSTAVVQSSAARPGIIADDPRFSSMLSVRTIAVIELTPTSWPPLIVEETARKLRSSVIGFAAAMLAITIWPLSTLKPIPPGTPTNRSSIVRLIVRSCASSRSIAPPSRLTSTRRLTISKPAITRTTPKALRTRSPPMLVRSPANSIVSPPTVIGSASKIPSLGSRSTAVAQSRPVCPGIVIEDALLSWSARRVASRMKSDGSTGPTRAAPASSADTARKLRSSASGSAALMIATAIRPESSDRPITPGTPAKKSDSSRLIVRSCALSRSITPLSSTSTSTVRFSITKAAVARTTSKALRITSPPTRARSPESSIVSPPTTTGSAPNAAELGFRSTAVVQSRAGGTGIIVDEALLSCTSRRVASSVRLSGRPGPVSIAPDSVADTARKLRPSVIGFAALIAATAILPLSTEKPIPSGTPAKKSDTSRLIVRSWASFRSMPPPL